MNTEELEDFLHLPLSSLAATQLLQVAEDILTLPATVEKDSWNYIWGSPIFSTSRAYKHLTGSMPTHSFFRKLWKSSCQNKHKFFFWLLLRNRMSTRELLRRRNMHMPSYACVCCNLDTEESLIHLFFRCSFAQSCWINLNIILVESDTIMILEEIRDQLNLPFFMEITITFCWSLWMQRNDYIFRGVQPSSGNCLGFFKKEFALVILRAKPRYKESMSRWLEGLV